MTLTKHICFFIPVLFLFISSAKGENTAGWTHSSTLGIALSGGNSSTLNINANQATTYAWPTDLIKLSASYLYGKSSGIESAKAFTSALRYERSLSEYFSLYTAIGLEGDIFSGYKTRAYFDLGGKFFLLPGDKKYNYLFTELGYRFSHQEGTPNAVPLNIDSHIIRSYIEGAYAISESLFGKLWIEILPDLSNSDNIQVNFEPSLNLNLNQYLTLKLAFLGRYDGKPNVVGNKEFDFLYTTSLVANF